MIKGHFSVQLTRPQDFLSVRKALARIKSDFLHHGHRAEQFYKIEMVLAEALNNIAEHGGPRVHLTPIVIKWRYEHGLFYTRLEDSGRPYAAKALPKTNVPRLDVADANLPEGGFGWNIISQLCDTLDYQRHRDKNLLSIVLRP